MVFGNSIARAPRRATLCLFVVSSLIARGQSPVLDGQSVKLEPGFRTVQFRALGGSGSGPSNITLQDATAQQQVFDFDIPDGALGGCTVAVYSDPARTKLVPDSDTAINPNAQNCNRGAMNGDLSSVVSNNGTHVQFISGLRGTRQSVTDGRLYSMSLAARATYFYTVSAGGKTAQGKFATGNINVGQNFPDTPLFDTSGTNFSNLQYPFLPDSDAVVVDPTTGIPIRKIPSLQKDMSGLTAFNTTAIDVSGGKWANVANCGSNNGPACSSNGAGASDYLFLPLPYFSNNFGSYGGWSPWNRVEDIVFSIYCGSANSSQTLRVWLSRDSGRTAASDSFDVVCPAGAPALRATLSDTANGYPHPWFSQWNPVKEWIKPEIIPAHGTVNTNGTAVSVASGDHFVTSVPAGSSILINGTYYQITSFIDSSNLMLTSSAGNQSGVAYAMASTGLRIANVMGTGTVFLSVGYNAAKVAANGYGTYNA